MPPWETVIPLYPDGDNLPLAELDDLLYLVIVLMLPLLGRVGSLAKKFKQKMDGESDTPPDTDEVFDVGPEIVEPPTAKEPVAPPERPAWRSWEQREPSREAPPVTTARRPTPQAEPDRPMIVLGPPPAIPTPATRPPMPIARPAVAQQIIQPETAPPLSAFRSVQSKPKKRPMKAPPEHTLDTPTTYLQGSSGGGVGRSAIRSVRSGNAKSLRQAIILAEILAPPIALRNDQETATQNVMLPR